MYTITKEDIVEYYNKGLTAISHNINLLKGLREDIVDESENENDKRIERVVNNLIIINDTVINNDHILIDDEVYVKSFILTNRLLENAGIQFTDYKAINKILQDYFNKINMTAELMYSEESNCILNDILLTMFYHNMSDMSLDLEYFTTGGTYDSYPLYQDLINYDEYAYQRIELVRGDENFNTYRLGVSQFSKIELDIKELYEYFMTGKEVKYL